MLPDGLLIWLQPDPSESEAAAQANAPAVPMAAQPALPAASILALAQDHGRVGLFVREIDTGRGWWDAQVFQIMGLPPAAQAPSMKDVLSRCMHPDDRETFDLRHAEHKSHVGRGDARFRIVRDGGQMRHLHSIFEVLAATPERPAMMMGVVIDDTDAAEVLVPTANSAACCAWPCKWHRCRSGASTPRCTWSPVHVDVTEHQLAQAALEQERQRTAFALASAGVGVWERRLDGGPSYLSPQALRLRGLGPHRRRGVHRALARRQRALAGVVRPSPA